MEAIYLFIFLPETNTFFTCFHGWRKQNLEQLSWEKNSVTTFQKSQNIILKKKVSPVFTDEKEKLYPWTFPVHPIPPLKTCGVPRALTEMFF